MQNLPASPTYSLTRGHETLRAYIADDVAYVSRDLGDGEIFRDVAYDMAGLELVLFAYESRGFEVSGDWRSDPRLPGAYAARPLAAD